MHFSIMVAGDDWEQQLAPFQENNMGDCPDEYLEFYVDGETYPTREEAERAVGKRKCDEDGYWTNPNSHWDWYVVGGRFQRKFLPKENVEYNKGSASAFTDADPKYAAQIRKKDIDFDRMKEEWTERHIKTWNRLMEILGDISTNWTPSTAYDFHDENERKKYWEQDGIKQIKAQEDFVFGFSCHDLDKMIGCETAEEWMSKYDWRGCYRPYGYIRDGEWIDADWHKDETYVAEFDKWFESLSGETLITVVDCHE